MDVLRHERPDEYMPTVGRVSWNQLLDDERQQEEADWERHDRDDRNYTVEVSEW